MLVLPVYDPAGDLFKIALKLLYISYVAIQIPGSFTLDNAVYRQYPTPLPSFYLFGTRCLVPGWDGISSADLPSREALWDHYYMGAPARHRHCVERFSRVKRAEPSFWNAIISIQRRSPSGRSGRMCMMRQWGQSPKPPRSTILMLEQAALMVAFR
jgi:hypothetical protein